MEFVSGSAHHTSKLESLALIARFETCTLDLKVTLSPTYDRMGHQNGVGNAKKYKGLGTFFSD